MEAAAASCGCVDSRSPFADSCGLSSSSVGEAEEVTVISSGEVYWFQMEIEIFETSPASWSGSMKHRSSMWNGYKTTVMAVSAWIDQKEMELMKAHSSLACFSNG
ncbi:unnamed protein product [Sphagnum jensenii]|uniref:Uncharacterized protein n=1 Tax=Sphagnum jensenii TaxID=128206 RepID=A0ABP1BZ61_9BRYO